jgi:hypothetical protein
MNADSWADEAALVPVLPVLLGVTVAGVESEELVSGVLDEDDGAGVEAPPALMTLLTHWAADVVSDP